MRALLAVDAATQIQLANQIIARRLSVREAEKLVAKTAKDAESASAPRKKANGVSRDLTRLEEALSDHLGTRVALKVGAKDKGQIVIDFHGWEHLNSCLNARACPEWSMPDALPVVAVLATGGTIAGAQADATSAGYKAGSFSVDDLLAAVRSWRALPAFAPSRWPTSAART